MDTSSMIEVTSDEIAAWMVARGRVTYIETSDGRFYRVLEPGERGPSTKDEGE